MEELQGPIEAKYGAVLDNELLTQMWGGPVMSAVKAHGGSLHGRLKSRSQAMKGDGYNSADYDGSENLPRMIFGGAMAPDQLAQELYDHGLIATPTPDALFAAIESELGQVKRFREYAAQAMRGARASQTDGQGQGVSCAPARIRRIMAQRGLRALQAKNFVPQTSDGRADRPLPNLLAGQPLTAALNLVWVSTSPSSHGRWLALSGRGHRPVLAPHH